VVQKKQLNGFIYPRIIVLMEATLVIP